MKAPDLYSWLGANRSDSRSYREDEQQRQGCKDKLSCFANCDAGHYNQAAMLGTSRAVRAPFMPMASAAKAPLCSLT